MTYELSGLGSTHKVYEKDIRRISIHYLKGRFLMDLIPLLPLHLIQVHAEREFYLIKVMRILVVFKAFDVHDITFWIKA